MMRKAFSPIVILFVLTTFFSCKTADDTPLVTEDSSVIWYGQSTADSLATLGITMLTYSIENEIAGTVDASIFYVNAPACGGNNVMTLSRNLGGSPSNFYPYSIKDQSGVEIWSGDLFISSAVCSTLEVFF